MEGAVVYTLCAPPWGGLVYSIEAARRRREPDSELIQSSFNELAVARAHARA
jgi:hypothetical protein